MNDSTMIETWEDTQATIKRMTETYRFRIWDDDLCVIHGGKVLASVPLAEVVRVASLTPEERLDEVFKGIKP